MPSWVLYSLHDGVRIVTNELPVALGGVGWRVSVGALCLADWVLRHADLFEGRSVLELGSGLGVTGIAAAHAGAARVCLTDALPELVGNLERVIESNAPIQPAASGTPCVLECSLLDFWDGPEGVQRCASHRTMEEHLLSRQGAESSVATLPASQRFDVVLAAECCYERYHASMLVRTIARRLLKPNARAYVLQAVREKRPMQRGGMLAEVVSSARTEGLSLKLTAPRSGAEAPKCIVFSSTGPVAEIDEWAERVGGSGLVMLEFAWATAANGNDGFPDSSHLQH
ncbi:hypothetical protein T492DRAFT_1037729 [Pavlovales sp. CCMP2436]|nr:hypothetical protein T492DRAFT_1037729 [Pavlovales sp. CCMP2436]